MNLQQTQRDIVQPIDQQSDIYNVTTNNRMGNDNTQTQEQSDSDNCTRNDNDHQNGLLDVVRNWLHINKTSPQSTQIAGGPNSVYEIDNKTIKLNIDTPD